MSIGKVEENTKDGKDDKEFDYRNLIIVGNWAFLRKVYILSNRLCLALRVSLHKFSGTVACPLMPKR